MSGCVETILVLLRHASHDRLGSVLCGRMPGVTLSEAGRREADALAVTLARHRFAAVLSSPLERAVETAAAIAASQALAVEVEVEEDLNELDLGAWAGLRFEDLRGDPAWNLWNSARSHARPPGGETMTEAQARTARCIEGLHRRYAGRTVALVSHADVIKAALCHALGLSVDFHARFEIAPASRSVLIAGEWGLKVHSINEATE